MTEERNSSKLGSGEKSSSSSGHKSSSSGPLQTTESEDNMGPTQSLSQIDSGEEQNDSSQEQEKPWGVLQPVITPTTKNTKKYGNFDLIGEKKEITFGRHTDNDYVFKILKKGGEMEIGFLPSERDDWLKISKFHFIIVREPDDKSPVGYTVYIKDVSSNGIYINGEKLTPETLFPLENFCVIALSSPENRAFTYVNNSLLRKETSELPFMFRQKYNLEKVVLGTGATGTVRRGYIKASGRKVAVKIIQKNRKLSIIPDVSYEAQLMKKVDHENIVKVYDVFEDDNTLWIVLEYVEGGELFDIVKSNGPIDEACSKRLFCELLNAVQYLHSRNIIHRDLKPENILLTTKDLTKCIIKITDFGLSRFVAEESLMVTQVGTPVYSAPEVLFPLRAGAGYTSKVDCWSLGCILYVMLSGYLPFDLENEPNRREFTFHPEKWDGISTEAKDMINNLLRVDVDKRFSIHEALDHAWVRLPTSKRRKVEVEGKGVP